MEDTADKILVAAGVIFAEKGFQRTTIREICQAAEVNVAAVNYYFGDKERLYIEAVKQAHALRIRRHTLPQWGTDTRPEQKLRDFVTILLARMLATDDAPWQMRLILREVLNPTKACREIAEENIRPQFEVLLAILSEMLPLETPEHVRRQIGFSIIGQCLHYHLAGEVARMLTPDDEYDAHYSCEQLAEHICNFSLSALGRGELLGLTACDSHSAADQN
jgi:TetR/AcrR family transcriptional regulator, regulator of cefoperazone and chloramphenicol sensitivity